MSRLQVLSGCNVAEGRGCLHWARVVKVPLPHGCSVTRRSGRTASVPHDSFAGSMVKRATLEVKRVTLEAARSSSGGRGCYRSIRDPGRLDQAGRADDLLLGQRLHSPVTHQRRVGHELHARRGAKEPTDLW